MKNTEKIIIKEFILNIINIEQIEKVYPFYIKISGRKNIRLDLGFVQYILSRDKKIEFYCNPFKYKCDFVDMKMIKDENLKLTHQMNFYEFKKTYLTSYKLINKAGFDSIAPNNLVLNKEYSCLDVFFWGGTKHYVMEMINEFPQDFELVINQENAENGK